MRPSFYYPLNPHLNILNANDLMPLDLAIRFGQDEIVYLFLGTKKPIIQAHDNTEEALYQKLMEAKNSNAIEEQIIYLEKLSDLYVIAKNFTKAAKVLNAALALLQQHLSSPGFEESVYARERIEGFFVESQGRKIPGSDRKYITHYRKWLKAIRNECEEQLKKVGVEKILAQLTEGYKRIITAMLLNIIEWLGKPPTEWAVFAMGSMAAPTKCVCFRILSVPSC